MDGAGVLEGADPKADDGAGVWDPKANPDAGAPS